MHLRTILLLFAALTLATLNQSCDSTTTPSSVTPQTATPTPVGTVTGTKPSQTNSMTRYLQYSVTSSSNGSPEYKRIKANNDQWDQVTNNNLLLQRGIAYVKIGDTAPQTDASTPLAPDSPPDESPVMSEFMRFVFLPFVLSHRTVGGAKGTEVVVWAKEINDTKSEVYYFYLDSTVKPSTDVKIFAYYLAKDGKPAEIASKISLPLGCYTMLTMELLSYEDNKSDWFLTNKNDASKSSPINNKIPADLLQVMENAHTSASDDGLNPSKISLGDPVFKLPVQ